MYKVPACKNCDQSFYVREKARGENTGRAPLVLDCGHNFCEQCVSKLASVTRNEIKCFTCQTVSPLKEGHSVKSVLPVNSYIVGQTILSKQLLLDDSVLKMVPKVMKTPSPGVKQSRTRLPKQEPCGECSVNAATCRCHKCDCVLCGSCFDKVHQASKMLRTHQAIPLYESDRFEKIATVCPEHDNRPIEYFCENDQTAICSHCVIVGKHQNHAINSIEEKNKEAVKDIDPALNQVHTIFQFLKRSDKCLHSLIPLVQRDVRSVVEEIRNQFLNVHSLLIAREKALIHEIEKICLEEVTPIDDMRLKVSEDLQKVASIIRDAGKLKQSASLNYLNVQAILDSLHKLTDMPCFADVQTVSDNGIKCMFDDDLLHSIQSYGKLDSSPSLSIKLLQKHEVPDDMLETGSIASDIDSSSIVSSEKPAPVREVAEGSESDAPVDTVSLLSDSSAPETIDSSTRQKLPMGLRRSRINLSRSELVYVSHIKNPSNFMIQKLAILGDLRSLGRKLNQHCCRAAASNEIPMNGLEPEAIVLAQFTNDSNWYRARVLSYEVAEEDPLNSQVEVVYVDYGNSEIVPLSRVRTIPSKFTRMPALAMKCALYDVLPSNESLEWSIDSVRAFVGMINDKPMMCLVKSEKDGILQVDLSVPPDERMELDQPVSMRDALVFLEHAWFKSSEATPVYPGGPIPKPRHQYLRPSRAPLGTVMTCIVSHVNSPLDFFIQQLGEDAQYLAEMMRALQEQYGLDSGDLWSIFCPQKGMLCVAQYTVDDQWYRAQVICCPGQRNVEVLYVDYGNSEIIPFWRLKKISKKFLILPLQALHCNLKDVEPVDSIKGWPEEAVTFIRQLVFKPLSAQVAGYGSSQLEVVLNETSSGQDICINAALVQHGCARSTGPASFLEELQVVPEKLVSTSPPTKLESHESSRYSPITISAEGIRTISSRKAHTPSPKLSTDLVKVTRKTKSESPKLHEELPGSYKPPGKKKSTKVKDDSGVKPPHMQVTVSNVVSPGHFYIQPCANDDLAELMIALQNQYRGREPEQTVWSVGDYCVAVRPEDVRWYRAQILEINQDHVKVFLPDYGFTETVIDGHLRTLDEAFHSQPAHALQCHLAEICPAGDITKWSQTACEAFLDIVKEQTSYLVKQGELEDGSLPADILLREYVAGDALNPDRIEFNSVAKKLLKKGVALPNRKTIGILVAAEEAKASLVTIPPKPLVPSKKQAPDKETEKAADVVSSEPQKNDLEKSKESEKIDEETDLEELCKDLTETGATKNWIDIVDDEEKQNEKISGSIKEEKSDISKPSEEGDSTEKVYPPEHLGGDDMGPDPTREETETSKDIGNDNNNKPHSLSKNCRRTKGISIFDKLQAQAKRRDSSEDTKISAKDRVHLGTGDTIPDAKLNEIPTKLECTALKDDEVLQELEDTAEEEVPKGFVEPSPPTSEEFQVVPTYVDFSGIIYAHVVPERESPEGRFGFILKEKTLETIMQNNYLERRSLHRGKIPRDGNCLFRAFAQGMYHDQSRQSELRKLTVDAMSEDWDVIQESVGVEDKESYLTAMSQNGSYGGEPEIQTLCTCLGIQAVIHLGGLNYPVQRRTYGQDSSKCIQLVYISDGNYDGGHYDLAVTSKEEADEINVVYEKWREVRVKQLQSYSAFEDNSTYDESLLGQLMDHLQKCHEKSLPDFQATYYTGMPVVCLYTDDCFYRAIVQDVKDDGITMLYVDFGNSEKLQPDRIRVKDFLAEIPIQCQKLALHDIVPFTLETKWPVKALEYIHSLVVTKQCTVRVQKPPVEGEPIQVTLTMEDGKDLGSSLVEMGVAFRRSEVAEALAIVEAQVNAKGAAGDQVIGNTTSAKLIRNAYLPMWDPYPGMIAAVLVTHVESPCEVYLQRSPVPDSTDPEIKEVNACLEKLGSMTEELQAQADFYPKLSDIREGMACCALYEVDNRWYRGQVLSVVHGPSPMVDVLFVDYGNKELVAPENVRAPPDDMISLPAQACLCKLAGVCPPTGMADWLPGTKDALTDFVVSKCLMASVKSLDDGVEVSLFEYEKFHEECFEERTDMLVYYQMLAAGLIQIHNVSETGVIVENEVENFT